MTIEIKQKICDDCQKQIACVDVVIDCYKNSEKLINHLCTDCHIDQQENEQIESEEINEQ
jgi:hypothetical protein